MTQEQLKSYIAEKLDWISSSGNVDLEEYYKIIDEFGALLINNPPKELK